MEHESGYPPFKNQSQRDFSLIFLEPDFFCSPFLQLFYLFNMESYDFNWLNNDEDIMDSLIGIASLPDEPMKEAQQPSNNVGSDIINYLLEGTQPNNSNSNIVLNQALNQGQPTHKEEELNFVIESTTNNPSLPFNVVQGKDNFVTFTPSSAKPATTKKQATAKKPKFKEPIFVTESPQSFSQKNKKAANSNSNSHSSGEDISDNEMHDVSSSNSLKQMTSKERRQLRNKISARNFRVRRKGKIDQPSAIIVYLIPFLEYITQLEEKVDEYEKTIEELRKENEQLKQSNQELLKKVSQPVTPPSSSLSSIESFNASSSSSEGNHSPEAPAPMFQFQLSDLYDVSLFDNQPQQQQQQQPIDAASLFYLNHAVMPDFDMSEVLGEKGKPVNTEELQREISREMLHENPLLAPALMAIVLRHTLSLEYVQSLADQLKNELVLHSKTNKNDNDDDDATVKGDELDDIKASINRLQLEDKPEEKKEEESEEEFIRGLLTNHFPYYAYQRALGKSHDEIVEKCKKCHNDPTTPCRIKSVQEVEEAKKAKNEANSGNKNLQTLQTYCRVAGALLRHPQRMARVRHVLKENIDFNDSTKTLASVEQKYKNTISAPSFGRRIAGSSH